MAWKSYHFKCPSLNGSVAHQFYEYLKTFLSAQGWELHDSYGIQRCKYTFTGGNYFSTNETITLDGIVYTMKATLTGADMEVLIGANLAASLANFALAINRTDPGTNNGVKYKCAAAHPTFECTSYTSTTVVVEWRAGAGSCAGNVASNNDTNSWSSWSGIQVWGTEAFTVWKSRGESGLEPYGYIHLRIEPTVIRYDAYQYWDATAHTGTRKQYDPSSFWYVNQFSTAYEAYIAGDKDMVYVNPHANYTSTVEQYAFCFGHVPKRFFPDLITTTDAIVAGSNVSIPVTDSSKVPSTGGFFQILGVAGEGCDKLKVASIPDATHIIVETLPRNYASGATIGLPASTFFSASVYTNNNLQTPFPVSYFSDAGLTVGTGRHAIATIDWRSLNGFYNKQVMTPFFFGSNGLPSIGWIDKGIFFISAPTHFDCLVSNNDGSIIITNILATSATSLTIVDSTKSWTTNQFVGKFVVLVGGTGIGQVRKITSNDGTTITIDYPWYTNPDATTTFRVYDNVWRYLSIFPFSTCGMLITHTNVPS
jgi:hypothetical protein